MQNQAEFLLSLAEKLCNMPAASGIGAAEIEELEKIAEGLKAAGQEEEPARYATVSWDFTDVQGIRPNWSKEKCEEELQLIEEDLADVMVGRGGDFLSDMLPEDGSGDQDEEEEGDPSEEAAP